MPWKETGKLDAGRFAVLDHCHFSNTAYPHFVIVAPIGYFNFFWKDREA